MPRGQYKRKSTKSTNTNGEVIHSIELMSKGTESLAPTTYTTAKWFEKLSDADKMSVKEHGTALAQAMVVNGASRIVVGQHLSVLRNILEPQNSFRRFLKPFHFSTRTAYRYIAGFENAKSKLHDTVLKVAMARGMNILGESQDRPLGVYTVAAKKLPPPVNPTEEQASAWLDSVEKIRRDGRSAAAIEGSARQLTLEVDDPTELLKQCYRFFVTRLKRVPGNSRSKAKFAQQLAGLILSEVGVSAQATVNPMPAPAGFAAERGRPRLVANTQAASA